MKQPTNKMRVAVGGALAVAAGLLASWAVSPWLHRLLHAEGRMSAAWVKSFASLDEMLQGVDAVVVARVEGSRPGRVVPTASGEPLVFTLVELRAEQVVRGEVPEAFVVEQTGGSFGGKTVYLEGDGGPYAAGQRVLLFLDRQPDTGYFVLANPQGRFAVVRGRLEAAAPEDPVAQVLDGRPLQEALARLSR